VPVIISKGELCVCILHQKLCMIKLLKGKCAALHMYLLDDQYIEIFKVLFQLNLCKPFPWLAAVHCALPPVIVLLVVSDT